MAGPFDELPRYGDDHFCIRTVQDGDISLWASRLEVTTAGALVAWARPDQLGPIAAEQICFMLAPGQWTAVFIPSFNNSNSRKAARSIRESRAALAKQQP
jgi:hypothetical protein